MHISLSKATLILRESGRQLLRWGVRDTGTSFTAGVPIMAVFDGREQLAVPFIENGETTYVLFEDLNLEQQKGLRSIAAT